MKIIFDKPVYVETQESNNYFIFTSQQFNEIIEQFVADFPREGIFSFLNFVNQMRPLKDCYKHSRFNSMAEAYVFEKAASLGLKAVENYDI